MKKYLSLLVVMAMVLTTLALPVVVSADEVVPAGTGEDAITITYNVQNTDGTPITVVHPGETFNLVISAQAIKADAITAFTIGVPYNTSAFTTGSPTYGDLFETVTIDSQVIDGTGLSLTYDGVATAGIAVNNQADPFVIATIPFTVTSTAAAQPYTLGEAISVLPEGSTPDASTSFVEITVGDTIEVFPYTVTATPVSITVESNSVSVNVDGSALVNGKTYYKEGGIMLSVAGTGITKVTLKKDQDTPVDHTAKYDSISVPASGSYILTITTPEGSTEYLFSVFAEPLSASIKMEANKAMVNPGGPVELTAAMESLTGEVGAAMISFDVAYDPTVFAFSGVATDLGGDVKAVKDENGKVSVIYGDKNSVVAENAVKTGAFMTLNFTAKSDAAANASCTFTPSNAKAAMYNTAPSADDFVADIFGTPTVTINPGTPLVVEAFPTEYARTQTLSVIVNGTAAKYAAAADLPEGTSGETAIKAWLATDGNGHTLVSGNLTIDKECDYYVLVDEEMVILSLNDLKIDRTGPVITMNTAADWNKPATEAIDLTSLNATDAKAGVDEPVVYYYYLGNAASADQVNTLLDGSSVSAKGMEVEYITLKAADKLGNIAFKSFAVMVDCKVPEVTFTKEGTAPANSVTLKLSATTNGSGSDIPAGKVDVYYKADPSSQATKAGEIDWNNGSLTVSQNGIYSVTVSDGVGNSVSKDVTVTEIEAAVVPALKAAVNATTTTKEGLLTDEALAKLGFADNGTFKYLKIEAGETAPGYKTQIGVTLDGAPFTEGLELKSQGKYVITVTTTSESNEAVTASATYTVNIGELPSINKDGVYNIVDYAVMKTFITKNVAPTAKIFLGGYFSGDVNGDFVNSDEDFILMMKALKEMAKKDDYSKYFEIAK